MSTQQSKFGRRYDEEFKREVAALAARADHTDEQVARDLGVSPWSVSRWRRRYGAPSPAAAGAPPPAAPASVSREELEREVRALRREVPAAAELKEIYSPGGGHSSFSTRQFHAANPRDHGSAPAMQDAKRALMWSYVLKGLAGSPASNLSALTSKLSAEEVLNAEKEAQKFMADNKLGPSTVFRSESW